MIQLVSRGEKATGLGGFEPPASGLEARRYVQAKPQAHGLVCHYFSFLRIINLFHVPVRDRGA